MPNITVITSGTSGIGKAVAQKIIKESGADDKIIINYGHSEEAVTQFRQELSEADNEKVYFIKADMSQYDDMMEFVAKIKEITPKIDWLVLNTGIGTYMSFEEYTLDVWDNVMRTNVTIPAFFVQQIKDMMAENGNIVFMGSHAGQATYSSSLVYSVSKAAVHFLARSLVKVFADQKVAINAIAPGFIETRWQNGRSDESRERINRKIAAGRFGMPEEVGEFCYSILSNDYLNGSIYDIHGGYDYF